MSTVFTYVSELTNTRDQACLMLRLRAAGYTPEMLNHNTTDGVTTVKVAEDDVDDAALLLALRTPEPSIDLTPNTTQLSARQRTEQVVKITGPKNALIDLKWVGVLPVSVSQLRLSSRGMGEFTIGPFPEGMGRTGHGKTVVINASCDAVACTGDSISISVI